MTTLHLYGGFGEKGRTSLGVSTGGLRLLLDAGIKVGAAGAEYHPAIPPAEIARLDAVFFSHAHEDHVGALSWLLARGFAGRVFISAACWAETPGMQQLYARPEDLARFALPPERLSLFTPGEGLSLGGLHLATGRSGHVPGGAWFALEAEGRRIVYCGDVVPGSPVLVMDPLPPCDLIVLDGSYGGDDQGMAARAGAIRAWLAAARPGCLLPLPMAGKPLEILALIEGPLAIHHSMLPPIRAQLARAEALRPAAAARIAAALARALPWADDQALPPCPLLVWDGMGSTGPSAAALARAEAAGYPVLLTGHLPAATPARLLHEAGRASWIRLPTHPVASENRALWQASGAARVLAHSADPEALAALAACIPPLAVAPRTGQSIELTAGHAHPAL